MAYNVLAKTDDFTVVSEYIPEVKTETTYQSEAMLENDFIKKLENQGYEYLEIHEEKDLIDNLKKQIEALNNIEFSNKEWEFLFNTYIANKNDGIKEKTRTIQEDEVKSITLDNGNKVNIKLIDKKKLYNNKVQVINQYEVSGKRDNRYDVTVLVNGLPLVHIELKRRGIDLKEAFNQINRYQRDSFWADSGLFEYIQIFVISNGTYTKYYSNTTRDVAVRTNMGLTKTKVSKSFEFTSFWADEKNNSITDLVDFAKTFFAKNTILKILTKYCIFTTEEQLMILRPYQIVAVEKILNKVEMSTNLGCFSKPEAGGYLFHTTGSGKTLSSFVAAQRLSTSEDIDKVIFVVDRKDLDAQTISEYEKFQKGAVNGNNSTNELKRQLEDKDKDGNYKEYRIIVTTIQKLGIFCDKYKGHEIFNKHIVIIFDECHRSQFGELNEKIKKNFKKYHMFGFTGTPIYAKKAGGKLGGKTTEGVFGQRLHAYTIVDAINDKNVLPFSIDYVNRIKVKDDIDDHKVIGIETKDVFNNPEIIANTVEYVLKNYNAKTKRSEHYEATVKIKDGKSEITQKKVMNGFNSLFACDSIQSAMLYYSEFKKQIAEKGSDLKIATIFSYGANDDEEEFDTSGLTKSHRDFLEDAIRDYNVYFGTNFDTGKEFYNYYLDLTRRIKNNEIDITIVVNMLLTGFDSPLTDVLWVDKNLEMHNLIQAFSRTNRILNSVKSYGKIVCFRNLEENVNEALALYGDKDASGVVILKSFKEYLNGYDTTNKKGHTIHVKGYSEIVEELKEKYPIGINILKMEDKKDFLKIFGHILRTKNILDSFDDFAEIKDDYLTDRQLQDYTSMYNTVHDEVLCDEPGGEKESIIDDIVFEAELVKCVAVNIDYILLLIEKYHESNCEDKELLNQINSAIGSSPQLKSKRDLIEQFYNSVSIKKGENIGDKWIEFIETQLDSELSKIIKEEKLKPEETRNFMNDCFRTGKFKTTGDDIVNILPPVSRFNKTGSKKEKKNQVIGKLLTFFEKFSNLLVGK